MAWGHTVTCCPDVTQVFAHVADAHPTFFGGVPRIWEKLKAALEAGFDAPTQAAVARGVERVRSGSGAQGDPADEAVYAAIRAKLGLERCDWYMIGAAPSPLEVLEFFAAIGIPIGEVWGMSETTSIATMVPRWDLRLGTVGPTIPGVEVRLADDGELLVRGATVMAGYRNQPEKTAETIDPEGWLHTGDVAEIDADGFVKIVDRKKELIINAGGKNMSPANIEQQLKQGSPLIGQAVAIGDGRPYNVALIVLDPDASAAFAAQHGLADPSPESMSVEAVVLEEVSAGVEARELPHVPGGADQAIQAAAVRLGARRRRADPDDEAQAQADLREVRRGDRGAVFGRLIPGCAGVARCSNVSRTKPVRSS